MTAEVAAALTWPVLATAGIAAGLLVVLAGEVVGRVVTVTHESGHMMVGFVTGGRVKHFYLNADREGGATDFHRGPGWLGWVLTLFAGYATPPLIGLGGAVLLKEGLAWPLLWTAVALFFIAWVKARDEVTSLAVLAVAGFTAYVGLYGGPVLKAAFATGLVVLLLFGGLRSAALVSLDKTSNSDPIQLARATWIPAPLWKVAFVAVALYCVWKGILVLAR
jgi:hypothetical protein